MTTPDWPVLRRYDSAHSLRIAMPVGGIGTGTVTLGGRGDLRDWEVVNRPAKGWSPRWSFFALRAAPLGGGESAARALEGPIDLVLYEGAHGATVPNHGLPRFRNSEFLAAYPFGQVLLTDPAMPVDVRLQAFNPLVPLDIEASAIPFAALRYVVRNRTDTELDVSVVGSLQNFIGTDGTSGVPRSNRNTARQAPGAAGAFLDSTGVDEKAEQWGSLALVVLDEPDVTIRTSWAEHRWGGELLDFWDDFTHDGRLDERAGRADAPMASVAARRTLPAAGVHSFTFLLAWHFPNRLDWNREYRVGNHYATRYADAWDVVERTAPALPDLERRTLEFVNAFLSGDLPDAVKEAALFNLSTLRTQTCFRTADGRFWGWEGCGDDTGCCLGNCTHVWNYEHATPYLFGELAKSMRDTEFTYGVGEGGRMSFRIQLPLDRARAEGVAAADGQMGCLVRLFREWRLSGDDDFLRALWPGARTALEFAWMAGGWDADRDGVMEGAQHNTMDVEYFGPNPQVGCWYLAALRAAERMARHLGDAEFAGRCADLFARGSAWLDAHLFTGEYYRHDIRPPGAEDAVAPGLRLPGIGASDLADPELQVGDGCLADQLVGETVADLAGLGPLLRPDHVRACLASIYRYNRRESLATHFNPMRSYALGGERGLLVASYPHGNRPARPFPYFDEVWTGLEYTAAVGMFCQDMADAGTTVFSDARARYDGRRRNPFDEAECGHHYVRAMASWGAIPALTGFRYDAVERSLTFAEPNRPTTWFWASGHAWGTVSFRPGTDGIDASLRVLGGELSVSRFTVGVRPSVEVDAGALRAGDRVELFVEIR